MARVLLDNGCYNNVGDLAMLQGVVEQYRVHSELSLDVVQPKFPSDPINYDKMIQSTAKINICHPLHNANEWRALHKTPYMWRYARKIQQSAMWGGMLSSSPRNWCLRESKESLVEYCSQYDALHFAGGGYLNDTFPDESLRKCALALAFMSIGKPVYMSGQQLGPFRSQLVRRGIFRVLRGSQYVGLREPYASPRHCHAAGLSESRYGVDGDDSFGLSPAPFSEVKDVISSFGLEDTKYLVGNCRISNYSGENINAVDRYAKFYDKLSSISGLPVLLVPISRGSSDSDVQSGISISRQSETGNIVAIEDSELSAEQTKSIIGHSKGAVGVSYHFCLFALSQGVPAVPIASNEYYSQKANGLMELYGLQKQYVCMSNNIGPDTCGNIWNILQNIDKQHLLSIAVERAQRWAHRISTQILQKHIGANSLASIA